MALTSFLYMYTVYAHKSHDWTDFSVLHHFKSIEYILVFHIQEYYGCLRQLKTSPMKLNLVAKLVSLKVEVT